MNSKDGYEWTEEGGLRQGVPSIGLILPASNLSTSNGVFDVIVIGAGYTALTAARDATASGNAEISFPSGRAHLLNSLYQACESYSWKHEIELGAVRGLQTLMDTHSRWEGLGFTGAKHTCGERFRDIR
jgi:hypothetical protein